MNDSLSLSKLLEKIKVREQLFLFTIDLRAYTQTLGDEIRCIQKLCFEFQNVIPNAQFIIELLEFALSNSS